MASIAYDTSTSASTGDFAASLTWSHTCTGNDRILIVFAGHGANNSGNPNYTATYNGVAMTEVQTVAGSAWRITCFYLINPASGANNVVVTSGGADQRIIGIAHSYTNALQSGQPDSSNTGSGSGSDFTASTTVVSANCWAIIGAIRSSTTYTGGSGTTLRKSKQGASSYYMGSGDSNGEVGTGSQALHLTGDSGGDQSTIVLSINNIPTAYTMAAAQASFTLTGQATSMFRGFVLTAAHAVFTLTGYDAMTTPFFRWINASKSSTSFSNQNKSSTSWGNASKNSTTFTNEPKS